MIGQIVGNYRVVRPLGEGGMGVVYLAEHSLLGRKAAIKVLLPHLSSRHDIVTRFFNEARAATTIADAGICQVFDFGFHTDGSAYIVMELLEGEPLDQRLRRRDRLAVVDALRITRQIATTLSAAHAKGIIHRDLKPENVFLVPDHEVAGGERAKILDFGIAKLAGTDPGVAKTQTGAIMGTPTYMSPEQCRGAGDIDHRSDIYALGCVLYHLLVGRPPFTSDGAGELIAMHLREAPIPPSTYLPELGPSIDALVLRCLAKAAADRYQTMNDVAAAIEQVGASTHPTMITGGGRTPVPSLSGPSWLPPQRTPTTLGEAAGAVGTAATVASPGAGRSKAPWLVGATAFLALGAVGAWAVAGNRGGGGHGSSGAARTDRGAEANGSRDAGPAPAGMLEGVDAVVEAGVPADAGMVGSGVSGGGGGGAASGGGPGLAGGGGDGAASGGGSGLSGGGVVSGDGGGDGGGGSGSSQPSAHVDPTGHLVPAAEELARERRHAARERERQRKLEEEKRRQAAQQPPTPPPPKPACPLDENGVPITRC